jgi:outer membrane receptor for ferric coprogen and ferric-rhodotorulic acid
MGLSMGLSAHGVLAQSAEASPPAGAASAPAPATAPQAAAAPVPGPLPVVRVRAAAGGDRATEGSPAYSARSTSGTTRLDLSPRETPQSVSVITRAQIDDFALHSVSDLLSGTTGVTVERVETDRTYFTARGFDISNFQIDGLGLPFATGDQLGDIDTAVYDRVEVLRGANGLLSSTGNPSATINFMRRRPVRESQAAAAVTLGSWNNRRVDGDLGGPLNESGSVRHRVVVAAQQKDSYLDRYSLEKYIAYGAVEVDLAPDWLLTLGHTLQANRPTGTMWGALPLSFSDGTPTSFDVSASTAADWSYWNTDDSQTFAELSHDLGDGWKAQASAFRRELKSDAELFYTYGLPDPVTGAGMFSYPSKYSHTERQLLLDVHASGPVARGSRKDDVVLGASWSKSNNQLRSSDDDVAVPLTLDTVLDGSFPRPAFDGGLSGRADFVDERLSGYAAVRLDLADDLKLLAGTNVTDVRSRGDQYGEAHQYSISKITPYLGLVKDLDASHSLYANYAGIFNPQFKIDAARSLLPPVQGSNREIGIKGEWLDQQLQGTLAVFQVKQDNAAEVAGFDADGGFTFYKGVNATSKGFELDLAGTLAPGWQVSTGYTRLQMDGDDGQAVRLHVPRQLFHLSSVYRVPALPGLAVGASLNWQGETSLGSSRQDAYGLLKLMARYELSRNLSLAANLNNVTDEKYLASLQWSQSYYGAPRNGTVTLRWTF